MTATSTIAVSPTPVLTIGTTTTQLNVRAEPRAGSALLGVMEASASVQILAKDPASNWYQIVYEQGGAGIGWVVAEYVSAQDAAAIPIVSGSHTRPAASVRERINVRSGPGLSYDAVGILNPRDVVILIGKDRSAAWLQIEFPPAPQGKGWLAASFLEAPALDDVPIVAESGEVVGTGTPTTVPEIPGPTLASARQDGDSANAPAVSAVFSPSGIGSILFTSDVSLPEGDREDWITISPHGDTLQFRIDCTGSTMLAILVLHEGDPVPAADGLACGRVTEIRLAAKESPYLVRVSPIPHSGALGYVRYTLSILTVP